MNRMADHCFQCFDCTAKLTSYAKLATIFFSAPLATPALPRRNGRHQVPGTGNPVVLLTHKRNINMLRSMVCVIDIWGNWWETSMLIWAA
jgi:hypothetical protein